MLLSPDWKEAEAALAEALGTRTAPPLLLISCCPPSVRSGCLQT